MPYAKPPDPNICTYGVAKSLSDRLKAIGVPVQDIFEITEGQKYNTTSENPPYIIPVRQTQFVAKIWGEVEQNLGVTNDMFDEKGYNWGTFEKLATSSNVPDIAKAIMELKNNYKVVNANLEKQMAEPDAPESQQAHPAAKEPAKEIKHEHQGILGSNKMPEPKEHKKS